MSLLFRRIGIFVLPFVALVLAGCASGDKRLACPSVSLVRDLDRVTVFAATDSTDLTDVAYSARFDALGATCDHGRRGVVIDTSFLLVALRGPADTERLAKLNYFVAITGPDGAVIAKEIFSTEIPFADNRRRVALREEVEPYIPYSREHPLEQYRVLIGFQLDGAQVTYNQAARR